MIEHGKYIVIEGPDGTGKTTQAKLLVEELRRQGTESRYVHEPGETPMGLELEKIIKDRHLGRSALTDLLLFTANRVEVYSQVIEPALANGEIVVADRNWLSSVAYQGIASGLGATKVRDTTRLYLPDEYIYPTFTALLYTPEEQRKKMLSKRGTSDADHFESQPADFQKRVAEGYEEAARIALLNHIIGGRKIQASANISAAGTVEEVHERILQKLESVGVILPQSDNLAHT